jgi:hypothetical protein
MSRRWWPNLTRRTGSGCWHDDRWMQPAPRVNRAGVGRALRVHPAAVTRARGANALVVAKAVPALRESLNLRCRGFDRSGAGAGIG